MTTPAAMVETVSAYVKAQWEAASFSLPVPGAAASASVPPLAFGNEGFTPPTSGATFALAEIKHGKSRQRTMGAAGDRKFEHAARLEVTIQLPAGDSGSAPLARVLDVVRGFLEGVRLSGLNPFGAANTKRQGNDGRMSFAIVEFPFTYNERK